MKKHIVSLLCLIVLSSSFARAQEYGEKGWPASEIASKCDEYFLKSIDPDYLRILRNSIFASYGLAFKDPELKEFFAGQDWYKVNPNFSESMLKPGEKKCVELIARVENGLKEKMAALRGESRVSDVNMLPNIQLYGPLDAKTKSMIEKNGFAMLPTKEEQLFSIYEKNMYRRIPNFVTSDSILQLYHIFFDFAIRRIESKNLLPAAVKLVQSMFDESVAMSGGKAPDAVKQAALTNAAYFAVAANLLGANVPMKKLPPQLQAAVKKELVKIKNHGKRTKSDLFPYKIEYNQFIPRGHYTRSKELTRYFMGMMWLGNTLFAFRSEPESAAAFSRKDEDMLVLRSLLIAHLLQNSRRNGKPLMALWHSIYDITSFFVGVADDLTPIDIQSIAGAIYGNVRSPEEYWDAKKISEVRDRAEKTHNPGIRAVLDGIPNGPQMRFMGQRYIADSEMLQKLSKYPERPFPKGLDVLASMSSDAATKILTEFYREQDKWPPYTQRLDELKKKFSKLTPDEWRRNMYYGWLWSLQALVKERIEGKVAPYFASTPAWQKKNLNTALASWTELRHDTILYGKQSGAECGGPGEYVVPPPPKGYVEPNVEFYSRLETLTRLSVEGLKKFGYVDDDMKQKYGEIINLISFLKGTSVKELNGESLSADDYDRIKTIGATLEQLSLSVVEGGPDFWQLLDETDRNMALVADVHTSFDDVLEEAVGYANEILVIAPVDGVPYLMRGAAFSYFEFTHPANDRLTDEKWQAMLKKNKQPDPPKWMDEILIHIFRKLPEGKMLESPGC